MIYLNKLSSTSYIISCILVYLFQLNDMYKILYISNYYIDYIHFIRDFSDFIYELQNMNYYKLITNYNTYYNSIKNILSYTVCNSI